MKVNICGIPYKIKEVPAIDEELEGIVQGKIIYRKCLIKNATSRVSVKKIFAI